MKHSNEKSAYRKEMDKAEKKSVAGNMKHIRLMLDEKLTPEQSKVVRKALSYSWVDGMGWGANNV